MNIERITLTELHLVIDFYDRCYEKTPNENDIRLLLEKPTTEAFKIGDVAFLIIQRLGRETEIIDIGVDPSSRGRGLAQALLNHIKTPSTRIFLEVNINNKAALSLYTKMGFEQISIRKKYYDGKHDALVMMLDV